MGLVLDKAVLNMDMPESCADCQLAVMTFKDTDSESESHFFHESETHILCSGAEKELAESWSDLVFKWDFSKPAWCPLRYPIIYEDLESWERDTTYRGGWNEAMAELGAVTTEQAFPWMKEDNDGLTDY